MMRPDRIPLRKTTRTLTALCLVAVAALTACPFTGTYRAGDIPQPVLLGQRPATAEPARSPRPDPHPVAIRQISTGEHFSGTPRIFGSKIDADLLMQVASPDDEIWVNRMQFRSMTLFFFFIVPVAGEDFRLDLVADIRKDAASPHER